MLEWLLLFAQIMLINMVLSGDNAVVIGMASKNLPLHQRRQALWWGVFGAIALRLILTIIAVSLLKIPYIQAVGSCLLMWIALKLLAEHDQQPGIREATSLGKAIWTIMVADFIMSLDNVLAIAAKANNDLGIIILGIGLSIPLIIWGSTIVVQLLRRFPLLIYLGAAILGFTAGEMFVKDNKMNQYVLQGNELFHWLIPLLSSIAVLVFGWIHKWIAARKQFS